MKKNKDLNCAMNLQQHNKQKGISMWSFLFVGGVFIFVLYVGAQLVPVYSSDSAINKALNASLENVTRDKVRKKEIVAEVDKRLYIDGVYEGPDLKESIEVKKQKKGTTVTLAYKKEIPLFFNIGIYLDFKHEVEK